MRVTYPEYEWRDLQNVHLLRVVSSVCRCWMGRCAREAIAERLDRHERHAEERHFRLGWYSIAFSTGWGEKERRKDGAENMGYWARPSFEGGL